MVAAEWDVYVCNTVIPWGLKDRGLAGVVWMGASAVAVHQGAGEPLCRWFQLEGGKMYIEPDVMVAMAEAVLHTRAAGKELWCIAWLYWFWEQEIGKAISDVKQGRL